jgi:hypothetical protein
MKKEKLGAMILMYLIFSFHFSFFTFHLPEGLYQIGLV